MEQLRIDHLLGRAVVAAKQPLTPEEVEALFSGTATAKRAPRAAKEPSGPWVRRYDRCANCQITQPALISFSGETDFSPSIPLDDRIRLEIQLLRMTTGRRTIALCSPCIDALRSTRDLTPSHGSESRQSPWEQR